MTGRQLVLVLATRNAHKVDELRRILAEAGLSYDLVAAGDLPGVPEVVESGVTFAANALLKAHAAAKATGLPAIADDSGLCVDVMGGMPGVFSARWSGGGDLANLRLVLAQLSDVPDEHRSAAFACAAALALPNSTEVVVEARWPGRVIREPRGSNGFGYDPIFVPDGRTVTSAELSAADKDADSHRARAFRQLVPLLQEHLPA